MIKLLLLMSGIYIVLVMIIASILIGKAMLFIVEPVCKLIDKVFYKQKEKK